KPLLESNLSYEVCSLYIVLLNVFSSCHLLYFSHYEIIAAIKPKINNGIMYWSKIGIEVSQKCGFHRSAFSRAVVPIIEEEARDTAPADASAVPHSVALA